MKLGTPAFSCFLFCARFPGRPPSLLTTDSPLLGCQCFIPGTSNVYRTWFKGALLLKNRIVNTYIIRFYAEHSFCSRQIKKKKDFLTCIDLILIFCPNCEILNQGCLKISIWLVNKLKC